jgi:hypothetical protein
MQCCKVLMHGDMIMDLIDPSTYYMKVGKVDVESGAYALFDRVM